MIQSTMARRCAMIVAAAMLALPMAAHAVPAQPRMTIALKALQAALSKLQNAEADKAGHRDKAIALVNQAIQQVQEGIQAGDR